MTKSSAPIRGLRAARCRHGSDCLLSGRPALRKYLALAGGLGILQTEGAERVEAAAGLPYSTMLRIDLKCLFLGDCPAAIQD